MEDDKLVQRYIALSSPSPTASAHLPDQTALRRILVPSEAVLQRLFDLTAAEARLACSISRGVGRSCGCSWCQGFDGAQPARQIDDQDGNPQARTAGRSARPGRLSGGLTWTPTHCVSVGSGVPCTEPQGSAQPGTAPSRRPSPEINDFSYRCLSRLL